jgi:phosphonoacetate hydrolase
MAATSIVRWKLILPLTESWRTISLHGRSYQLPTGPVVVICVDGFDPEYLQQGLKDGILPNLASIINSGFHETAECAMPSFTNPNNVSIITGAPTAAHGIAGNFYLDSDTKEERMVVDDTLLCGETLLQLLSRRGVRVAAITAKDKLRRILRHGLFEDEQNSGNICFSAEKAASCTMKEHGIVDVEDWVGRPAPSQYSGDLSLYVLDAGVKLLQDGRSDALYLTLSDYVQHKYAPGAKESDAFLTALDARIGDLANLASVVGVTGDHGMSNKSQPTGDHLPNVLFLQDKLEEAFGAGSARVICPITDPFVRHHGALGGFVRVYARSPDLVSRMMETCSSKTWLQVEMVLSGADAAERFEMPLDREADFVVIAASDAVIGSKEEEHDLAALRGHPLRSHGGLSEQKIPLIVSKPCHQAQGIARHGPWRNFDIFHLVLNGAAES